MGNGQSVQKKIKPFLLRWDTSVLCIEFLYHGSSGPPGERGAGFLLCEEFVEPTAE